MVTKNLDNFRKKMDFGPKNCIYHWFSLFTVGAKAVIDERPKSPIEKRKRNLIFFSPISRRERETWNSFPQFREEKEKFEKVFFTFEKWKRKGFSFLKFREEKEIFFLKSPTSRREREIWNSFPQFWEEKEKFGKGFSTFEKRKRNGYYFLKIREEKENFYQAFWKKKSLSAKLCQSYCDSQSFRESESLLCQECDFSSNAMHKSWQLLLHVRASPRLETTLLTYFPKCCSLCCYWS